MEIRVLSKRKDELQIEIDNLTIAELLRKSLWQDNSIQIAAWRREHPTKNPVLIVHTKDKAAKKALLDCINRLNKLNLTLLEDFKKAVKH